MYFLTCVYFANFPLLPNRMETPQGLFCPWFSTNLTKCRENSTPLKRACWSTDWVMLSPPRGSKYLESRDPLCPQHLAECLGYNLKAYWNKLLEMRKSLECLSDLPKVTLIVTDRNDNSESSLPPCCSFPLKEWLWRKWVKEHSQKVKKLRIGDWGIQILVI